LLRRRLRSFPALLLAFGLALDPGLAALSRQANGSMMALASVGLALAAAVNGNWRLAGIFAGLSLLGGPAAWAGLFPLALAWALGLLFNQRFPPPQARSGVDEQPAPGIAQLRTAAFWGLGAFLLAGTLAGTTLPGLGAAFAGLGEYLRGWGGSSEVPASRLVMALAVYQFPALILLILGAARSALAPADYHPVQTTLYLWLLAALLLGMVYPARQPVALGWALLPLWALAALELSRWLTPPGEEWVVSLGQAVVMFVLGSLTWVILGTLGRQFAIAADPLPRLGILAGVSGLAVLVTVMAGLGWSWRAARQGAAWGLGLISLLGLAGAAWGAAQTRLGSPRELWSLVPAPGETRLLEATLEQLSIWTTSDRGEIDVVVTLESPALRWLLRDYPQASYLDGLPAAGFPDRQPAVLITAEGQASPALSAGYRGQDFIWRRYPAWSGSLPENSVGWFTFREAPLLQEKVILWARADLLPGGLSSLLETAPPAEQPAPHPESVK
jgi:hypothetical protein